MSPSAEQPDDAWPRLRAIAGVAELPLPWPVARAVRLGLHASARRFYRLMPAEAGTPRTVVLVLYERDDAEAVERYARTARWFHSALRSPSRSDEQFCPNRVDVSSHGHRKHHCPTEGSLPATGKKPDSPGVRVPRIFARSARALVVEDGGDRLLAEATDTAGLRRHYDAATRAILALQRHGRAHPPPNPGLRLDGRRLRDELDFTEQHALRGWLKCGPSRRRDDAFDRLAAAVAEQPRRLCHRDFHSRNLLVNGDMMVLDFQDAMVGPLFYDLASLLRDDYRDVPTGAAARALETFWSGAAVTLPVSTAGGVPREPGLLPPAARQGLALTAAQRSLKALGTFGYQVSVAGRDEYARYARRTWRHARHALRALGWEVLVDDLAAFDRL